VFPLFCPSPVGQVQYSIVSSSHVGLRIYEPADL